MTKPKDVLKMFSQKPVAYYPIYAQLTGSVSAGIVLSQLLYWWYAVKERDFYKTDEEFSSELSMGIYEFRTAKELLKKKKLVKTKIKGIPAKTYYIIDIEALLSQLTCLGKNLKLDCVKTSNKNGEKPQTITESTQRIHIYNGQDKKTYPPTNLQTDFKGSSSYQEQVKEYAEKFGAGVKPLYG